MQAGGVDRSCASVRPSHRHEERQHGRQATVGEAHTRAHTGEVLVHGGGHVRGGQPLQPQLQRLRPGRWRQR